MNYYYGEYVAYYEVKIQTMMKTFDIELVVYDETEYFREFDDPEFNYPFQPRKSILSAYKFEIPPVTGDDY